MKKIKKFIVEHKVMIFEIIFSVVYVLFTVSSVVYAKSGTTEAASATDPVKGINSLASWFLSLVQAIGAIFVIKNGYEMFTSYQQNDNSGMSSALKGLVGGIGMVSLKFLLQLLGVNV